MARYVSIPSEIEAVQYSKDNWAEVYEFTGHFYGDVHSDLVVQTDRHGDSYLWVEANQGRLLLEEGEWILRDELGFYPCKNDIFIKKYRLKESTLNNAAPEPADLTPEEQALANEAAPIKVPGGVIKDLGEVDGETQYVSTDPALDAARSFLRSKGVDNETVSVILEGNVIDLAVKRDETAQLYTDEVSNFFYLEQAIKAVQLDYGVQGHDVPGKEDLFIVWFSKVLGNWKALVGVKSSTLYFEVTHNGNEDETYVDTYVKRSNRSFTDAFLNSTQPIQGEHQ
jgi:hypothetical protein